jgi:hypothetical protein
VEELQSEHMNPRIPYNQTMSPDRQTTSTDDSRQKIVIVVAVLAAVAIGGLFYFLLRATSGGTPPPTLEGAIRSGSPEWDQIASKIVLDDPEADEAKRALGDWVMSLHTTVRNFSGRTLSGLEIKAAVVDHEGKSVKERTVVVIPTERQPELGNNKTMLVTVLLDGMKDTDVRANIKMEVTGFRFK